MFFSNSLIQWYLNHKRDLPWRDLTNPYPIWLSEIMLQQTRVAQGLPYYTAFLNAFPTVFDLANADEEQVLRLWQGLGYYSRARNLHETAKFIAYNRNGVFPGTYKELLELKGVGEYTAAAIASFAYNEPVPVVDGNVFRVLARYFDVSIDISASSAKKEFAKLALEVLPQDNPATFNQAIMEFGALQCVPKNPNCGDCIFNSSCAALQKNKVATLPIKSKKVKVTPRFFNYIVLSDVNNLTLIKKRVGKGIWENLYEFPLIETEKELEIESIMALIQNKFGQEYALKKIAVFNTNSLIHKLSHQHLFIRFWKLTVEDQFDNGIPVNDLVNYPFPVLLSNFIERELLK